MITTGSIRKRAQQAGLRGGAKLLRPFKVLRRGPELCSIGGAPELRTAGDLGKPLPLRAGYGRLFALMAARSRCGG